MSLNNLQQALATPQPTLATLLAASRKRLTKATECLCVYDYNDRLITQTKCKLHNRGD